MRDTHQFSGLTNQDRQLCDSLFKAKLSTPFTGRAWGSAGCCPAESRQNRTAMPLLGAGVARWWLHPLMLAASARARAIPATRLRVLAPRPGRARSARLPGGWLITAEADQGSCGGGCFWRPMARGIARLGNEDAKLGHSREDTDPQGDLHRGRARRSRLRERPDANIMCPSP
jgi:hypothetical protein